MTFDGKAFGADIVAIVKGHMERSIAPLNARLDAMEKAIADLPVPKDGKDADVDEVAALAAAALLPDIMEVRGMVEALPASVELPDFPAVLSQAMADSEGRILMQCNAMVDKRVELEVAALPAAENGKDADPEQVASLVKEHAERILAGWERPQDGKDGAPGEKGADGRDGVDGQPGKDGADGREGKDGAAGLNGKDGIDAMDVMVDREGELVFTMSDGRMKNVGLVMGRDGEPGKDGVNGTDGHPGINGKDGLDGIGFDDLDLVETDAGLMLRCVRGDNVKEWRLPVVIDRGVFKEGTAYAKGAGVTWAGSFWIAQDETADKPDSGKGWRLAVKRGRDGKDSGSSPPKKPGPVKVG